MQNYKEARRVGSYPGLPLKDHNLVGTTLAMTIKNWLLIIPHSTISQKEYIIKSGANIERSSHSRK